jgi:hypothetical protein
MNFWKNKLIYCNKVFKKKRKMKKNLMKLKLILNLINKKIKLKTIIHFRIYKMTHKR